MQKSQKENLMGEGKIFPTLIRFSLPATVGMTVNALYNIVDRIFLGNAVGNAGIAATAASLPLTYIILSFSVLGGMGSSTLVSTKLGESDHKAAQSVLNHALIYFASASLLTVLLCMTFADEILRLFGATDDVLADARLYSCVLASFSFATYISMGLNHNIRSAGHPQLSMLTVVAGALINVGLDFLFVIKLSMGVLGAALATALSQTACALWVIIFFLGKKPPVRISFKDFDFDIKIILKIMKIGSAQAAAQFTNAIVISVMNHTVVRYSIALASTAIFSSINNFLMLPAFGINQGTQTLIAYNVGAKNKKRESGFYLSAQLMAFVTVLILTVAVFVFSVQIGTLFDKNISDTTSEWLKYGMLMSAFGASAVITSGYFQAKSMPHKALVLSLSRQLVFYIPLLMLLPRYFGFWGIVCAQPISDAAAFLLSAAMVMIERKGSYVK